MKRPASARARWGLLFLIAAVAIGGGRLWHARQPGAITPVAQRRTMPALSLTQLDGSTWNVADHRGQVVLINYWATWCEPCRDELPGLIELARATDAHAVAFVGIALDTGPNAQIAVRNFAAQFHLPYPIAIPDATTRGTLGEMALPTTILLDKHGRIARTYTGEVERADFAKDIATLLAEN
jgi:cytochrome c biogenesis protein CcmG/thiol:disulfide interchange protein DsbE